MDYSALAAELLSFRTALHHLPAIRGLDEMSGGEYFVLHFLLRHGGTAGPSELSRSLYASSARIAASIHYYSSPLILYNHLATRELGVNSHTPAIICLGKEWYRFGSSFFIPNKEQQVAFVKSGFDGLLPQVLAEAANHS